MSEKTCKTCRWFFEDRLWGERGNGDCLIIHAAGVGDPLARILPAAANAKLRVKAGFGCRMHEHTPKEKNDADHG